ncbi:hypothetical protein [Wenyingzhuangia fucanilytica]|nr:hypothetical protein [Wenyingzhuangia fucanilytica]
MILPFLVKIPIKKLQRQHQKLIQDALLLFNKNKAICSKKIKEAERVATRIQHLKKYIVSS